MSHKKLGIDAHEPDRATYRALDSISRPASSHGHQFESSQLHQPLPRFGALWVVGGSPRHIRGLPPEILPIRGLWRHF